MSNQTVEIVNWTPEKIKQAALKQLFENAPNAAKFIEVDARRRLDAIKTPDTRRDRNYRLYLSKYILTHAVEMLGSDNFVIAVGMKVGKDGQKHHGWWIEKGSSTAPAHPFLRPAVLQNAREIIEIMLGV